MITDIVQISLYRKSFDRGEKNLELIEKLNLKFERVRRNCFINENSRKILIEFFYAFGSTVHITSIQFNLITFFILLMTNECLQSISHCFSI